MHHSSEDQIVSLSRFGQLEKNFFREVHAFLNTNLNSTRHLIAFNLCLYPFVHNKRSSCMNHSTWEKICEYLKQWPTFKFWKSPEKLQVEINNTQKDTTSRPARVSNTVPRPPAVSHFWVEKPSNSMNNEMEATHTAEYTAFPANWKPICHKEGKKLIHHKFWKFSSKDFVEF